MSTRLHAAVLALAAILGGCAGGEGDAIVFAVSTAPRVLDPRLAADAASDRVSALLFDRLVHLDESGRAVPGMADWEMLSPTHYRVVLRPDRATFVTGRQPTAADVAFTYLSVLDTELGSPHASALAHIAAIAVVDDSRLDFRLSRPDYRFASHLTLGIVPAPATDRRPTGRQPDGSGTFAFEHWHDGGGVRIRRRADQQRVDIIPVPDPTMRALKLIRHEAHLLQNDMPSELFDYLAADGRTRIDVRDGTTFAYLGFNLADPVLSRREVRAAIAHAIDRDAIIRYLLADRAIPAESVLRPGHWAGPARLQPLAHDVQRSRDYLRQAGFDDAQPLVLHYKTSTDPFRLRIAHVLQHQLAEVGIELRITSYDWGTFFGDIKAGRFQLYSLAWVGVNTPDILRYAFHSDSTPPAGANRGRYTSAEVDALIDQAERVDSRQAAGLYADAQRRIHDDLVYVPLWYEGNIAASRGITGYRPGFDGNYLALNRTHRTDDDR